MLMPWQVMAFNQLPDTGQTKCYNETVEISCAAEGEPFYGQDSQYRGLTRSYTKLAYGDVELPDTATQTDGWIMTRDNVTGLIWEIKTDDDSIHDKDNVYTWCDTNRHYPGACGDGDDTEDFIRALNEVNYGGHNDWRLSTVKELSILLNSDITHPGPILDTEFFPNTVSANYWSSNPYTGNTVAAWQVFFDAGSSADVAFGSSADVAFKSDSFYVRAVRGGLNSFLDHFQDNGDGTMTDIVTGLMWQKCSAGQTYDETNGACDGLASSHTWQDALSQCESLSLAGHEDWRLPNRNELQTLVDYSRNMPAYIDTTDFSGIMSSYYWSSTTRAIYPDTAWLVGFSLGFVKAFNKSIAEPVRAVRGGVSRSLDSDGDGIPDDLEDVNQNGTLDDSETDPFDADTDDDGILDGEEDANSNGSVDPGESDPLNPNDPCAYTDYFVINPFCTPITSSDIDRVVIFDSSQSDCYEMVSCVKENRVCTDTWNFGGTGNIVGGNGGDIVVYQYDNYGGYTASLTMTEEESGLAVTKNIAVSTDIVQTPLPAIDFNSDVNIAAVTLSVTDQDPNDADIASIIIFWGDRYHKEYSWPLSETINHVYKRIGIDYFIRVKALFTDGGEFNFTFRDDEDLKVNVPSVTVTHQAAIVGPLSGAKITAHKVTDPRQSLEGSKGTIQSYDLASAGLFVLSLNDAGNDDWIIVSATGGEDIDHDGDGSVDASPTTNQGTLHALAKASDWKNRNLHITPITELAYRYVEHLFTKVSQEDLVIRLGDLARKLIKTDIDGNDFIDWYDILAFDPANPTHLDKLTTSYSWLSSVDDDGYSIITSLLTGDEDQMLSCMDETFSYLMTRFPVPDSRYSSIKVALSVFGPGSATSGQPYNLSVNSTLAEPIFQDHVYLPYDESSLATFTATATSDSQILSWSGCETVSTDLSQCTVSLKNNQSVVINFGRTETQLAGVVHDLSNTINVLDANSISVEIGSNMIDMIAQMATANIGDFVVGDDGSGFLRRITAINQVNSTNYQLDTEEATLEEVIRQGTGHLFKQMTNSDLEGYTPSTTTSASATVSPMAFVGLAGTELKISGDPHDHTFTITLGATDPVVQEVQTSVAVQQDIETTVTQEVILYDNGFGDTLTATGSISLDIALDTGFDYSSSGGLEAFKFITLIDAQQRVEMSANAELAEFDFVKKKIGTLRFARIKFMIYFVPVWITPTVDVFLFAEGKIGAEASFGMEFEQKLEGGLLYNKTTGFSIHNSFSKDFTPILPTFEISASIKGGLKTSPALKIYDATGPAVPIDIYTKLKSSASTEIFNGCSDVLVKFLIGAAGKFKWDLSGSSKIGELLHLDQLEDMTTIAIVSQEWPIKKWTLYDNCSASSSSYLHIEGKGILSTINEGYSDGITTILTVSNTGNETLFWNTFGIPTEVLVSPSSGELATNEKELVQMSLATAGLPAGRYRQDIFFYNESSVGSDLPDEEFGNSFKTIDVTVNRTIIDAPSLISAFSSDVGEVSLSWDFLPAGSEPYIGFQIMATQTPDIPESFLQVYTTNIYNQTAVISGFEPGLTYSFALQAYQANGTVSQLSNTIPVTILDFERLICDSTNLDMCISENDCTGAGGYWWSNNTCKDAPEPLPTPLIDTADTLSFGHGTTGECWLENIIGWRDILTNGVAGFKVFRNGSNIATITDPGITVFRDKNISIGNTYCYKVSAYNDLGTQSALSNEACLQVSQHTTLSFCKFESDCITVGGYWYNNTCNALPGPLDIDDDGDGYSENNGDCDDSNPSIFLNAPELCDLVDNDCDNSVDESCIPPPPPTGGLNNIIVNDRYPTLRYWDSGNLIDNDQIDIILNGQEILSNHILKAPPGDSKTLNLQSGYNTLVIHADNNGDEPPNTASIEISSLVSGEPIQSYSIYQGEEASMTITLQWP
jgi:hypothetical protein